MSVLFDTGVIAACVNAKDAHAADAERLLDLVKRGTLGRPVATDWAIAELMTLLRARRLGSGVEDAARAFISGKSGVPGIHLEAVGLDRLDAVHAQFARHRDRNLSFVDASHLAVMADLGIKRLATFDAGFRGLVPVVPDKP